MVCRSCCEVDEHYCVTGVAMIAPGAVRCKRLESGWNLLWIPADIEPDRFKNSCNGIVYVSSYHVTARIRDSLAPFRDISRSKPFPVRLENVHTGFTLVDLVAATECHRCHAGFHQNYHQIKRSEFL